MKKIVAFLGSPRKNKSTGRLAERVIRGAEDAGAEVSIYDLNHEGLRGCQGCFYCRKNDGCATKDYLQPAYDEIKEADAIIFTSPIYFYQIAGQAKLWLDRMYPLIGSDMKPRHPGKKALTIFAHGVADKDEYIYVINNLHKIFKGFGWEISDSLLCAGTTKNPDLPDDAMLDEAYAAGKRLVE